jgi:esterase FrsA
MIWGGIDVWKSDLEIHSQSNALLRRGVATLALDMPGTGEAPLPVSTGADRLYSAARDFIGTDPRLDPERIGAYGLSFGGHFAVKLALMMPALKGVVQVGGPIHHAFAPEHASRLPFGTRIALARVMGVDANRFAQAFEELSLTAQALLPAKAHAPLLSINGELDELVPIADLHWLSRQGVRQDILTFADDRHVASRHRRLHEEFAASWLANKLGG